MLLALEAEGRGAIDRVIEDVAERLAAAGLRLAGLVQSNPVPDGRDRCDMTLRDLASGRDIKISQDLGKDSRACRLDPGALETAVGWVQASLQGDVDALVLNKFGKREQEGAGLRPVIAQAVAMGLPVVVGLRSDNRAAWQAFCCGAGEIRPASAAADVARGIIAARRPRAVVVVD